MSLNHEKAAALTEMLAQVGEPVVWKGQTYNALISDNPLSQDLGLGGTDASLVALAERLGLTTLATFDRRHFTVVRPAHTPSFKLLPA